MDGMNPVASGIQNEIPSNTQLYGNEMTDVIPSATAGNVPPGFTPQHQQFGTFTLVQNAQNVTQQMSGGLLQPAQTFGNTVPAPMGAFSSPVRPLVDTTGLYPAQQFGGGVSADPYAGMSNSAKRNFGTASGHRASPLDGQAASKSPKTESGDPNNWPSAAQLNPGSLGQPTLHTDPAVLRAGPSERDSSYANSTLNPLATGFDARAGVWGDPNQLSDTTPYGMSGNYAQTYGNPTLGNNQLMGPGMHGYVAPVYYTGHNPVVPAVPNQYGMGPHGQFVNYPGTPLPRQPYAPVPAQYQGYNPMPQSGTQQITVSQTNVGTFPQATTGLTQSQTIGTPDMNPATTGVEVQVLQASRSLNDVSESMRAIFRRLKNALSTHIATTKQCGEVGELAVVQSGIKASNSASSYELTIAETSFGRLEEDVDKVVNEIRQLAKTVTVALTGMTVEATTDVGKARATEPPPMPTPSPADSHGASVSPACTSASLLSPVSETTRSSSTTFTSSFQTGDMHIPTYRDTVAYRRGRGGRIDRTRTSWGSPGSGPTRGASFGSDLGSGSFSPGMQQLHHDQRSQGTVTPADQGDGDDSQEDEEDSLCGSVSQTGNTERARTSVSGLSLTSYDPNAPKIKFGDVSFDTMVGGSSGGAQLTGADAGITNGPQPLTSGTLPNRASTSGMEVDPAVLSVSLVQRDRELYLCTSAQIERRRQGRWQADTAPKMTKAELRLTMGPDMDTTPTQMTEESEMEVVWVSHDATRDGEIPLWKRTNRRDPDLNAPEPTLRPGSHQVLADNGDDAYLENLMKWELIQTEEFPQDPSSRRLKTDNDEIMWGTPKTLGVPLTRLYLTPEPSEMTWLRVKRLLKEEIRKRGSRNIIVPQFVNAYEPNGRECFGLRSPQLWFSVLRKPVEHWDEEPAIHVKMEVDVFIKGLRLLATRSEMITPLDVLKLLVAGEVRLRDLTVHLMEEVEARWVMNVYRLVVLAYVQDARYRLSRTGLKGEEFYGKIHGLARLPLNDHSCKDDPNLLPKGAKVTPQWSQAMQMLRGSSYQPGVPQRIIRFVEIIGQDLTRTARELTDVQLVPRIAQVLNLGEWLRQMFAAYAPEIRAVVDECFRELGDPDSTARVTAQVEDNKLQDPGKEVRLARLNAHKQEASEFLAAVQREASERNALKQQPRKPAPRAPLPPLQQLQYRSHFLGNKDREALGVDRVEYHASDEGMADNSQQRGAGAKGGFTNQIPSGNIQRKSGQAAREWHQPNFRGKQPAQGPPKWKVTRVVPVQNMGPPPPAALPSVGDTHYRSLSAGGRPSQPSTSQSQELETDGARTSRSAKKSGTGAAKNTEKDNRSTSKKKKAKKQPRPPPDEGGDEEDYGSSARNQ